MKDWIIEHLGLNKKGNVIFIENDYYDISIVSNIGETFPIKRNKMRGFNVYKNGIFQEFLPYLPIYKRK